MPNLKAVLTIGIIIYFLRIKSISNVWDALA